MSKQFEHHGIKYERFSGFLGFHNKYRLLAEHQIQTKILDYLIITEFYELIPNGLLTLKIGFESDGPSGPSVDTENFMRGAFGHDCGYRMIRLQQLPAWTRLEWDLMLYVHCREDDMTNFRATYVYRGVANFARTASLPSL